MTKNKRKKKVLVGWTYNRWKDHVFFNQSPYPEDDSMQRILEICAIKKYASVESGSIVKVRITIEEI